MPHRMMKRCKRVMRTKITVEEQRLLRKKSKPPTKQLGNRRTVVLFGKAIPLDIPIGAFQIRSKVQFFQGLLL